MKRIFLLLLITCSGLCYAQNIKIDFATKKITVPSKSDLQSQKDVQIVVENLPTAAYKVSINKTDSFISAGTPPPLFSVMNFGDGFNSLLAGLSGYTIRNAGQYTPESITHPSLTTNDKKEPFTDALLLSPCKESVVNIMPIIKDMRKKVFEFHFKFRDDVVKKADRLIYDVNLANITALKFKSDAESIIKDRLDKDKEIENAYTEYYDKILPFYTGVTNCIPLAAADSMLTSYKKSFNQFLNKFDSTFNELMIVKIYKQLNPPAPNMTFTSLPYRLKGDIIKFSIDISGIDPAKTPQSYTTVVELEKHPNRLWSFTSGVFVSNLINHDFSIRTNVQPNAQNPLKKDTLNYSILQEDNNQVSAGINALMHIGGYFGEKNDFGAYVAFGPGLTLEKSPQVRAFIGAGLLFGRTNKLALSFGWSGGLVKRIATNYNLTDTYNPAPADVTRDRFKGGGFISLGYSIFGK